MHHSSSQANGGASGQYQQQQQQQPGPGPGSGMDEQHYQQQQQGGGQQQGMGVDRDQSMSNDPEMAAAIQEARDSQCKVRAALSSSCMQGLGLLCRAQVAAPRRAAASLCRCPGPAALHSDACTLQDNLHSEPVVYCSDRSPCRCMWPTWHGGPQTPRSMPCAQTLER
jgi:hypothetical protein